MAYIERSYLTEQFEDLLHDDNIMNPVMKVLDALEIIDTAPTADVVEVKHGKWKQVQGEIGNPFNNQIVDTIDLFVCSVCGEHFDVSEARNFCSNCGAKMDGKDGAE